MNSSDDDDVPTCPLCMEELDSTDRSVRACNCGYQVCLWCLNKIRQEHNGRCPACRTPYEEHNFKFSQVNPQQAAREDRERANARKEREKRMKARELEKERARAAALAQQKALANLKHARIEQRNLVYVMGLSLTLAREEVLRRPDMFGKFGRLLRVLVNKSQPYNADAPGGPSITAYVQYYRDIDASAAVRAMNGETLDGREIRCSIATTKYCDAYIARNSSQGRVSASPVPASCGNPGCMYFHEAAPPTDVLTIEDVNSKQLGPPPPAYLFQGNRRHVTARGVVTRPVGMSPPSLRPHNEKHDSNTPSHLAENSIASSDGFRTNSSPSQQPYQSGVQSSIDGVQAFGSGGSPGYVPLGSQAVQRSSMSQNSEPGSNGLTGLSRNSILDVPVAGCHQETSSGDFHQVAAAAAINGVVVPVSGGFDSSAPAAVSELIDRDVRASAAPMTTWPGEAQSAMSAADQNASLKDLLVKIGGGRPKSDKPIGSAPQKSNQVGKDIVSDKVPRASPSTNNNTSTVPNIGEALNVAGVPQQQKDPLPLQGSGAMPGVPLEMFAGRSRFTLTTDVDGTGGNKSRFSFVQSSGRSRGSAEPDKVLEDLLAKVEETKPRSPVKSSKTHQDLHESNEVVRVASDFEKMSYEQKLASIFGESSEKSPRKPLQNFRIQNLSELGKVQSQVEKEKPSKKSINERKQKVSESGNKAKSKKDAGSNGPERRSSEKGNTSKMKKVEGSSAKKGKQIMGAKEGKGKDRGGTAGTKHESSTDEKRLLSSTFAGDADDDASSDNAENVSEDRKLTKTQRRKREKKARQREKREKKAAAAAAEAAGSSSQGVKEPKDTTSTHLDSHDDVQFSDILARRPEPVSSYEDLLLPSAPDKIPLAPRGMSVPLAALQTLGAKHGELERTLSMAELEREVEAARERESILQNRLSELQQRIRRYDNIRA